jgi:hypothetical protein
MAGQPTPPRLVEPFANNATECTQAAPVAGGKTFPFPVTSQLSVLNGAASLTDGFVPLNMTPTGGVPPFGIDMNGILFIISSWAAFFAAGQYPAYDATLQAAMGGYAEGARVQQAANPLEFWTSAVSANMTDPDTGGAGWISSVALYSSAALTGVNNVALPGASDYIIDVSAAGGAITYTGFVAQRDGQKITFRKSDSSANAVNFTGSSGSSTTANQMQTVSIGLPIQYATFTIQYNATLARWVQI